MLVISPKPAGKAFLRKAICCGSLWDEAHQVLFWSFCLGAHFDGLRCFFSSPYWHYLSSEKVHTERGFLCSDSSLEITGLSFFHFLHAFLRKKLLLSSLFHPLWAHCLQLFEDNSWLRACLIMTQHPQCWTTWSPDRVRPLILNLPPGWEQPSEPDWFPAVKRDPHARRDNGENRCTCWNLIPLRTLSCVYSYSICCCCCWSRPVVSHSMRPP